MVGFRSIFYIHTFFKMQFVNSKRLNLQISMYFILFSNFLDSYGRSTTASITKTGNANLSFFKLMNQMIGNSCSGHAKRMTHSYGSSIHIHFIHSNCIENIYPAFSIQSLSLCVVSQWFWQTVNVAQSVTQNF